MGGAIHNFASSIMTVTGSTISGNTATNEGGGISDYHGGSVLIDNSTIEGNDAAFGGGISADQLRGEHHQHDDLRQ